MKKYFLFLSFTVAGCQALPLQSTMSATPSPVPRAASPSATAPALLMRLRTMTADNACVRDEQCATVPIGARACGGPEAFLAYSTAGGVEPAMVAALAGQFSAARAANVVASGAMSTCSLPIDPGALCVASVCQLRAGANDPR